MKLWHTEQVSLLKKKSVLDEVMSIVKYWNLCEQNAKFHFE